MLLRTFALASIAFALSILAATDAVATAQRTFVASNGNDANACSIALPCRSFAAAIAQTTSGGEVIVLDSAGYGTVTIAKSVSINAASGIYAGVSVTTGDGITIDDGGGNSIIVVLRGLTVTGLGGASGIRVTHAATTHVEDCVIAGFPGNGIIHLAGMLYANDTILRNNGTGVYLFASATANLDRVRIEAGNSGLYAQNGAHVTIANSVVSGNSVYGVAAITGSGTAETEVDVAHTEVTYNNIGVYSKSSITGPNTSNAYVEDSNLTGNSVALRSDGPSSVQRGTIYATHSTLSGNDIGVDAAGGGAAYLLDVFLWNSKSCGVQNLASGAVYSFGNNYATCVSGSVPTPVGIAPF